MENENLILIAQFCKYHQVEPSFIVSLDQYGLVTVVEVANERYISAEEIMVVEKMMRLHYDLGINLEGIDAIAHLLKQIEKLQEELRLVENKLTTFAPNV